MPSFQFTASAAILFLLLSNAPAEAKNRAKPKLRAPAQSKFDCSQKPWNHGRQLSIQEIKIVLDSLSRNELIQITWSELLHPHADSVALPLLTYLSRTEENKYVRGYFEWLYLAAFSSHNIDNELGRWPARRAPKLINASLQDLCAIYVQARD